MTLNWCFHFFLIFIFKRGDRVGIIHDATKNIFLEIHDFPPPTFNIWWISYSFCSLDEKFFEERNAIGYRQMPSRQDSSRDSRNLSRSPFFKFLDRFSSRDKHLSRYFFFVFVFFLKLLSWKNRIFLELALLDQHWFIFAAFTEVELTKIRRKREVILTRRKKTMEEKRGVE